MLLVRHYAQDGIKLRVETVRGDNGIARISVRAKIIEPSESPDQGLVSCKGRCSPWSHVLIPNGGYKDGLD